MAILTGMFYETNPDTNFCMNITINAMYIPLVHFSHLFDEET